ncbi:hypothetical protein [Fibrella aquatilis]|uniref:DUF1963 domain-containing protein n=1 Tax=Fibrella aquatilis TaxID=2817059 RepID=A0A939G8R2_9BACT|nr:hypothetical protein [Fibrella aquatilis]MBO0933298.1 hypothetical protein [Fibrella aquatilis]
MTLGADFFYTPTIRQADSLSVFVSFDFGNKTNAIALSRQMAVNSQDQFGNTKAGYCRVVLHQAGNAPTPPPSADYVPLPLCQVKRSDFSAAEMADEVAEPGRGLDVSKFGGIPGWLQDDIFFQPRYDYALQLSEYDIRRLSPAHEGIFRGGMGYLYIDNNAKKLSTPAEGGYFFIQFT